MHAQFAELLSCSTDLPHVADGDPITVQRVEAAVSDVTRHVRDVLDGYLAAMNGGKLPSLDRKECDRHAKAYQECRCVHPSPGMDAECLSGIKGGHICVSLLSLSLWRRSVSAHDVILCCLILCSVVCLAAAIIRRNS